ncbi:olee1-like protein [Humulus lupulus]|uniref:olee1-like protein n=1 Tax=Humulus lupulus TaxID=3486 RepID=UPI002B402903|nr:olee1-like protein [Humulus lupulus]
MAMAKPVIMFASAVCLLSLFGLAHCEPRLLVEGKVYCDTCRTQFLTKASYYIKGARVKLECREDGKESVTLSAEAETDEAGSYRIPVEGDHEDETCGIQLVRSDDPVCSEISEEPYQQHKARISLTTNNGIASPVRQANPLGFLVNHPFPECKDILRELGMTQSDLV